MVFTQDGSRWESGTLPLPDNVAVSVVSTSSRNDEIALQVTGFLQPTALYFADLKHPIPPAGSPESLSFKVGPDGKTQAFRGGQPIGSSGPKAKLVSIDSGAGNTLHGESPAGQVRCVA